MKRLALILFFSALALKAQTFGPDVIPNPYTVARLPTTIARPGVIMRVTDGASTSDCSVGGGSSIAFCFFDGVAWQALNINPSGGLVTSDLTINFIGKPCTVPSLGWATDGTPAHKVLECDANHVWNFILNDATVANYGNGPPGAGACDGGIGGGQKFFYVDLATFDVWECGTPNRKFLTTTNSGTFSLTGQAGSAPATPGAGLDTFYFDNTLPLNGYTDLLHVINSSGVNYAVLPEDTFGNIAVNNMSAAGNGSFGNNSTILSATYVSGLSTSGGQTAGLTCRITPTGGGGGTGAVLTVTLTGVDSFAGANITVSSPGTGFTSPPTTGTVSNGTASNCGGTPVITTVIIPIGAIGFKDLNGIHSGTATAPTAYTGNRTFTLPDATGTVALTSRTDGTTPGGRASMTATLGPIADNTEDTVITAAVPAGANVAGTTYRVVIYGDVVTAGGGSTSTFRIHFGTAGTTADATIMTFGPITSGTGGTTVPFKFEATITFRTTTQSEASGDLFVNNATTGFSNQLMNVGGTTNQTGLTTSAATILVTYQSTDNTKVAPTFRVATIELVKL